MNHSKSRTSVFRRFFFLFDSKRFKWQFGHWRRLIGTEPGQTELTSLKTFFMVKRPTAKSDSRHTHTQKQRNTQNIKSNVRKKSLHFSKWNSVSYCFGLNKIYRHKIRNCFFLFCRWWVCLWVLYLYFFLSLNFYCLMAIPFNGSKLSAQNNISCSTSVAFVTIISINI